MEIPLVEDLRDVHLDYQTSSVIGPQLSNLNAKSVLTIQFIYSTFMIKTLHVENTNIFDLYFLFLSCLFQCS